MEISYKKLSPETLLAVISEYVTRESTDYGDKVFSLNEKIAMVQSQLEKGTAIIVFDGGSGTSNVVSVR